MSEDKKSRQRLLKKDKDFSQKIIEEMQEQEKTLKGYFKQYSKPVSDDPSIIKRQLAQDRTKVFSQMFSPFRVFTNFYEHYWNAECATPEEQHVLNMCKSYTKRQMSLGLTVSLILTSLVSYKNRMYLRPISHIFGLFVGGASGLLFGVLSSTKYTLEKFQSLGASYAMGRSSLLDIQKYRMDRRK